MCLCSWTLIIYCCWTVIIIECGQYLFRGTPDDFGKQENNKALWADQCVSVYPRPIRCHGKIDEQTELIMRNQLRGGNCPFKERTAIYKLSEIKERKRLTWLGCRRAVVSSCIFLTRAPDTFYFGQERHNGRPMGILCFCCMAGTWQLIET